jgi:hypothetical protein
MSSGPGNPSATTASKAKVPWLPSRVHPGQPTEACPRCGAKQFFPWTLRRDGQRVTAMRTWVCASCQHTEEREELEPA